MFSALIVTLPTRPSAVRLRIWRALKALGCAALRDGAYVLPQAQAARFAPLAEEVNAHGGSAAVWQLAPASDAERDALLAQFDRGAAYADWQRDALALARALPALAETEARRRWRAVGEALRALRAIDYFPGEAAAQAQSQLDALRAAVDARFARGEPAATRDAALPRLQRTRFVGKRWATRRRPWVDRLACGWFVLRFVDAKARFVWLDDPAAGTPPPRGAIGFDYDGARFSHVGALVSVEVMAASFGVEADAQLQRVLRAVHVLDVGGIPVPEAAGLEAVLAGLRELHADDDRLLHAAAAVFDALYAAPLP